MSLYTTTTGLPKCTVTSYLHYVSVPKLYIIKTSKRIYTANFSIVFNCDIPSGQEHNNNNCTLPVSSWSMKEIMLCTSHHPKNTLISVKANLRVSFCYSMYQIFYQTYAPLFLHSLFTFIHLYLKVSCTALPPHPFREDTFTTFILNTTGVLELLHICDVLDQSLDDRLTWLAFSVVFLSPFQQILGN
jgi:hypothetical protein